MNLFECNGFYHIGDKRRLYDYVKPQIKPGLTYIEPFAGAFTLGTQLLYNGVINNAILSDISPHVVDYWKCVQSSWDRLYTCLYRVRDKILKDLESSGECDLLSQKWKTRCRDRYMQSAKYWWQKQLSWGVPKYTFTKDDIMAIHAVNLRDFRYTLNLLHNLMRFVDIYNTSYDYYSRLKTDVFFFFDPPYYTTPNRVYYDMDKDFNHYVFSRFILNCSCKYVLCYDNTPEILKLYKSGGMMIGKLNYFSQVLDKEVSELLITNDVLSYRENLTIIRKGEDVIG